VLERAVLIALIALPAAAQEDNVPPEVWLHRPLMTVVTAPDSVLAPFVSDGCSGGMSDFWAAAAAGIPAFERLAGLQPPWESCCTVHDRAYHDAGGATEAAASAVARLQADAALRQCIAATAPGPDRQATWDAIAEAMFQAVRLGGLPCTGLSWRWGYGFAQCFSGQ
jgi:hypothetical protein